MKINHFGKNSYESRGGIEAVIDTIIKYDNINENCHFGIGNDDPSKNECLFPKNFTLFFISFYIK